RSGGSRFLARIFCINAAAVALIGWCRASDAGPSHLSRTGQIGHELPANCGRDLIKSCCAIARV
ncbi:hypothetical protein, partial [Ralstonia solanacearum]|uniref:hypothetical protein n=1 Tax=Ralstonia solanacearum TaxID=305 RepID=UPI001E3CF505